MRLVVAAVGRLRDPPLEELCLRYRRRIPWPLELVELNPPGPADAGRRQARETAALLASRPAGARTVVLDERGQQLDSRSFAGRLGAWRDRGVPATAFLLGGPEGHGQEVRDAADLLLGFGQLTWPHELVRLLLFEQLYRATAILAGHPYHRD